jgi:pyruvate/2-oxoglutarate dehydrogenase complex dihydrolipoamide dehydrogenase (E3) component
MLESIGNAVNIDMLMIDDLLEEQAKPGSNVLVVGGDQIGMQAADYLSEAGKKVWVAEATGHFAPKLAAHDRWYLLGRTDRKGVRRIKHVHGVEIDGEDKVWLVTGKGRELVPAIDTIVFAGDRRSDRSLAEICERRGLETHIVGDAFDVTSEDGGTIFATIAQAYDVARSI